MHLNGVSNELELGRRVYGISMSIFGTSAHNGAARSEVTKIATGAGSEATKRINISRLSYACRLYVASPTCNLSYLVMEVLWM